MGILSKAERDAKRDDWGLDTLKTFKNAANDKKDMVYWEALEMARDLRSALATCDALEKERDARKKLEHIQAAGLLDHENVLLGDRCAKLEAERGALTRAKEALSDTLSETLARSEGLRKERDALLEWRRGFVKRARKWKRVPGAGTDTDISEKAAFQIVHDLAAVDIEPKPTEADRD